MFDSFRPIEDISKARILVTNDDGIGAPGITVLEEIARSLSDDVWVVAPEWEQSGAGHSLTFHDPVRVRQVEERRYAVRGTPTDCVLLGAREIIPYEQKPVDLILSGINRGQNVGDDVTYSGTIAAAMEGTLLGIPSIALSQRIIRGEAVKWQAAEHYAPQVIRELVKVGWPENIVMNVNFPDAEPGDVHGIRFAHQGKRRFGEHLDKRYDPNGNVYYWIGYGHEGEAENPGSDIELVENGYVVITPLSLDLTDYKLLAFMREKTSLAG